MSRLPDRDADTVADWLRRHPSVEIVARDRAEVYGEGVRQGAPGAVHLLDRWHVLRNLGEALQEAVTGQHSVIRSVARTFGDERAAALRAERNRLRPLMWADRRKQERHAPRQARHAELRRLHAAGAGNGEDGAFIEWLRRQAPGLANAADLATRLAAMLRGHSAEAVEEWLAAARSSALRRFAASLQRDAGGLANAIALPWSTGPAEGHISRLKAIKRSMYGRAGFEFLRQRELNPI